MEVSGEVADLLVREGLQVAEVALRLSGSGVVNAAALVTALLKENYKLSGKVGVGRLNKENAEAVVIPIRARDLRRFKELAKKFGVLYAAVRDKNDSKGVVHIISNTNYAALLNAALEEMKYPVYGGTKTVQEQSSASKKEISRAQPDLASRERGNGSTVLSGEDKPSVRRRLDEIRSAAKGRGREAQRNQERQR